MANNFSDEVMADTPAIYARFNEASGATVITDFSGNGRHGQYTLPSYGVPASLGEPSAVQNEGDFSARLGSWDSRDYTFLTFPTIPQSNDFVLEIVLTPIDGAWRFSARRGSSGDETLSLDVYLGGITAEGDNVNSWFEYVPANAPHDLTPDSASVDSALSGTKRDMRVHLTIFRTGLNTTWGLEDSSLFGVRVNGELVQGRMYPDGSGYAPNPVQERYWRYGATAPHSATTDKPLEINGTGVRIDELAYYDHALSPERIRAHYLATGVQVRTRAGLPPQLARLTSSGQLLVPGYLSGTAAVRGLSGTGDVHLTPGEEASPEGVATWTSRFAEMGTEGTWEGVPPWMPARDQDRASRWLDEVDVHLISTPLRDSRTTVSGDLARAPGLAPLGAISGQTSIRALLAVAHVFKTEAIHGSTSAWGIIGSVVLHENAGLIAGSTTVAAGTLLHGQIEGVAGAAAGKTTGTGDLTMWIAEHIGGGEVGDDWGEGASGPPLLAGSGPRRPTFAPRSAGRVTSKSPWEVTR